MTFLAPLAGIIGAALAIPALLALYLLRLRRRPLRVSSTLLWEQAAQDLQVNVPLRSLRWSWLLLLHFLALACFLIALARPAIGEGGTTGARIVIVIDRSASMSATDAQPDRPDGEPRMRLDDAKRKALELIDSIGRGGAGSQRSRCMIVAMGAAPAALTTFTPDLRALRDAVNSIQPSDEADKLATTLALIDAITTQQEGTGNGNAAPVVYLFTDGVVGLESDRLGQGVTPVVTLVPTGATPADDPRVDNVGIVSVNARFDLDDPGLIRVFARIVNAGPTAGALTVRCTIDGALAPDGVKGVGVPAATLAGDGTSVLGEAAAVFAVRPLPGNQPRTVIVSHSRPDVLAADDAAGVVLPPSWRPRILVVVPDPDDPAKDAAADVFLLQALEATEPASLRVIPVAATQPAAPVAGAAAKPSPWAGTDIVVFDRVALVEELPSGIPTISFGASIPSAGAAIRTPQTSGTSARALAWRRDHPALRYVGLDMLLVAPASWIEWQPVDSASGSSPDFASLVDGPSGPLIAEVTDRNPRGGTTRRLLISFDLTRSNWGPDISFPLFIGNAIEYLSAAGDATTGSSLGLSTSDPFNVSVPSETGAIVSTGAQELSLPLPGDAGNERVVQVGPLDRVGIYSLQTADGRPVSPAAVVVNLTSEQESHLLPVLTTGRGTSEAGSSSEAGPQEVWHWFILIALGLLTVEWFVYAWRMKG